ncbi:hypothetical protein LXL04_012242 [Taraxacum kok-saghyz]
MMNWIENTDCCKWGGITCNHLTGDVIGIDLSCGMLRGTIHPNTTLFHLPHLQTLNLAFNKFSPSQLPREIGGLSKSLTLLNLSYSGLTVDIPWEILYLSKLVSLDLSSNYGLQIQPSVLKNLLRNFMHLRELLLSEVDISWVLPRYLNISTSLKSLDLSYTDLQGKLPDNIFSLHYLEKLDMSNNDYITGPWPNVNKSNNIPLKWLDLSYTNLSGEIPKSVGHLKFLNNLRLNSCGLVGSIPKYLVNMRHLTTLDLSSNKLKGTLPSLLFTLPFIENINLYDLGNNRLNGTFPHWLGDLRYLQVLVLKSNKLHGPIETPSTTKNAFPSIVVLILSHNEFAGLLPQTYLQNFSAMKNTINSSTTPRYLDMSGEYYSVTTSVKGAELQFLKLSVDYIIVDLSNNRLEGEIPNVIGSLTSLIVLDLSHNNLTGQIPSVLGNLSEIESLDLSWNQLTGEIPQALASLKFLEFLNLSQNHLTGHIPLGGQFNTFSTSFEGNPNLCGFPRLKKCELPHEPQLQVEGDGDGDEDGKRGFTRRVVMLGFGCGTLIGLVMGYVMLSTGTPKWFNAIADDPNKRRYVYIGR